MIYKMTLADSTDSMTFDLLEVPIADKDIEGAVDNTLVNGNVFTDYLWLKKQWTQKWALMCDDEYTQLRGFYTRQWENAEAPTYRLFYGNNITEDVMRNGSYITENIDAPLGAEMSLTQLSGNATQTTYSGKNLADSSIENFAPANATISETDGILKMTANSGVLARLLLALPELTGGTTYTISCDIRAVSIANNGATTYLRVREPNSGSWVSSASPITLSSSFTQYVIAFTPTTTVSPYLWFYLSPTNTNQNNVEIYVKNIQLEVGSTATAYEPYVGGTASPNPDYPQAIEVVTGEQTVEVTGKNLASLETTGSIVGGVSFLIVDGIIHLSGTTEANKNFFFDSFRTNSGSATFWIEVTGYTDASGNSSMILQQSDDNSSWANLIEISMLSSVNKVRPVTLDSSKYYRIRWYVNSNTFTNATIKVQLEYGSTKTSFEQYQGQSYAIDLGSIELAKIGTYQDRIYKDDGTWYIEKQVGKVVLDSSNQSNWGVYQSGTPNWFYYWQTIQNALVGNAEALMSNYGSFNSIGATDTNQGIMIATNGLLRVRLGEELAIADWKAKVVATPMIVYYALATPTTTEITDETLLSQLNFIANLYGGVNHISLVGTGAQGTMEVKIHKIYEQETEIYPQTAVRLTLTDDGIINPCGCRRNVQIKMRETIQ